MHVTCRDTLVITYALDDVIVMYDSKCILN